MKGKGANAETWTYGYDNQNHLIWAEDRATPGGTLWLRVDVKYDAFGNRIEKDDTVNSVTTMVHFAYDQGNVWADTNNTGALQARHFFLDAVDSVFADMTTNGSTTTLMYDLTDRQGSVRDMMDANGAVQDAIAYSAYGQITSESNPSVGDRYKYTGSEPISLACDSCAQGLDWTMSLINDCHFRLAFAYAGKRKYSRAVCHISNYLQRCRENVRSIYPLEHAESSLGKWLAGLAIASGRNGGDWGDWKIAMARLRGA
jgi:hypothetical protein